MRELPNWVVVLIILLICLIFILLVMFDIPQKAIENVKVIIKVIWGSIA